MFPKIKTCVLEKRVSPRWSPSKEKKFRCAVNLDTDELPAPYGPAAQEEEDPWEEDDEITDAQADQDFEE